MHAQLVDHQVVAVAAEAFQRDGGARHQALPITHISRETDARRADTVPATWVQSQIERTLSGPPALERVRALLREAPEAHRTAIADRLYAELGFVAARGRAQRASCLKALRVLERRGQIVLPAARTCPRPRQPCRLRQAVAAPKGVPGEAGALEGLEIVLVADAAQRAIWNELMAREHPRGIGPPVGAQLRYLVASAHGWLAALGFGGGSLHLTPRDHWIGWNAEQRRTVAQPARRFAPACT